MVLLSGERLASPSKEFVRRDRQFADTFSGGVKDCAGNRGRDVDVVHAWRPLLASAVTGAPPSHAPR
jgi:hypothetical protein